jgi:hypothetical protein
MGENLKRTLTLLFLSAAVMLGLSMAAFAQVTIHFTGPTEGSCNGVGTGISGGTLNGSPATFFCDDYPHHINYGESWEANVSTLASLGSVQYPNPGRVPTLQAYSEVAWLAENLPSGGAIANGGTTDPSTISWAIWSILYPYPPSPPGPLGPGPVGSGPGGTGTAITDAQNWRNNHPLCQVNPTSCVDNIAIYTPVDRSAGGPQEFVGNTPEPVSMLLVGTFLSLAGGLLREKRLSA